VRKEGGKEEEEEEEGEEGIWVSAEAFLREEGELY